MIATPFRPSWYRRRAIARSAVAAKSMAATSDHAVPCVGEHLPDDTVRAIGLTAYLLDAHGRIRGQIRAIGQQLHQAAHDLQGVVQLVGEPRDEPRNRASGG